MGERRHSLIHLHTVCSGILPRLLAVPASSIRGIRTLYHCYSGLSFSQWPQFYYKKILAILQYLLFKNWFTDFSNLLWDTVERLISNPHGTFFFCFWPKNLGEVIFVLNKIILSCYPKLKVD